MTKENRREAKKGQRRFSVQRYAQERGTKIKDPETICLRSPLSEACVRPYFDLHPLLLSKARSPLAFGLRAHCRPGKPFTNNLGILFRSIPSTCTFSPVVDALRLTLPVYAGVRRPRREAWRLSLTSRWRENSERLAILPRDVNAVPG